MTYLTALGSVLAIIAIVIVGGAIIAFITKTIINVFDAGKKVDYNTDEEEIASIKNNVYKTETINENNYEAEKEVEDDFSYALEVDNNKAEAEKQELKKEVEDDFFDDYKPSEKFNFKDEDEEDDFDIMNMIDEISDDVLEDKKVEIEESNKKKAEETASILDKYSIDSVWNSDDEEDIEEENEEVEEKEESVEVDEIKSIRDEIKAMLDELKNGKQETVTVEEIVEEKVDEKIDENLVLIEDLKRALQEKEAEVAEIKGSKEELENQIHSTISSSEEEIASLKAKLEEVSNQLEEERSANWKVAKEVVDRPIKLIENNVVEEEIEVEEQILEDIKQLDEEEIEERVQKRLAESTKVIQELTKRVEELTTVQTQETVHFQYSTEEQYLNRIEVLEERLRVAKKELKANDKEYRPLQKVKKTLDRDKAKLRRKDAIACKKKVALYGVNNYVDIDREKAEKLAHELELLDGLRLSVNHCEEVMNANRERYPILEHTHNILSKNIEDLETDIAELNKELQALRDKKDKE